MTQLRQTLLITAILVVLLATMGIMGTLTGAEPPKLTPPAALTADQKLPILDLLLEYSTKYQRRTAIYTRTIAPLDTELQTVESRINAAIEKLSKPGYTLDWSTCFSDNANRSTCLTYIPKPPDSKEKK